MGTNPLDYKRAKVSMVTFRELNDLTCDLYPFTISHLFGVIYSLTIL